MNLSERKLKILQAIIRDFILTAEPVGSRTLSKKYDLGVSAATIRNEMSDLEDIGLLTHPHTSAGRAPSEKAYRLYVNEMMKKTELTQEQKDMVASRLFENVQELDKTIERVAELLSEITNLTAFAMTPEPDQDTLKYINFLPVDDHTVVLMVVADSGKVSNQALHIHAPYENENLQLLAKSMTYHYKGRTLSDALTMDIIDSFQHDLSAMGRLAEDIMPDFMKTLEDMLNVHLYMDGLTNIFDLPEYNDIDRARMFMEMIEKKEDFTKKLIRRKDGLLITIGNENDDASMKDCSLITASYHVDGKFVGKLGVIGPTRMRYSQITSVIEYLTDHITHAFELTEGRNDDGDR